MPKFFPKRTVIAVTNAAYINIPVSLMFCRKMEIVECPPTDGSTYNAQGLTYQLADDNYTANYGLLPGDTLRFGDDVAQGTGLGRPLGLPATTDPTGATRAAFVPVKVKCATSTATQVEVREYA